MLAAVELTTDELFDTCVHPEYPYIANVFDDVIFAAQFTI